VQVINHKRFDSSHLEFKLEAWNFKFFSFLGFCANFSFFLKIDLIIFSSFFVFLFFGYSFGFFGVDFLGI
jgi:hypothetical protein